jgi:hypothetical protein
MKKAPAQFTVVKFKALNKLRSHYGFEYDKQVLTKHMFFFYGEIPQARGHCIIQSMDSPSLFLTMVHMSDLRLATDKEF